MSPKMYTSMHHMLEGVLHVHSAGRSRGFMIRFHTSFGTVSSCCGYIFLCWRIGVRWIVSASILVGTILIGLHLLLEDWHSSSKQIWRAQTSYSKGKPAGGSSSNRHRSCSGQAPVSSLDVTLIMNQCKSMPYSTIISQRYTAKSPNDHHY